MAPPALSLRAGGIRAAAPPGRRRRAAARALDARDFEASSTAGVPPQLIPTIGAMRKLFGAALPADIKYASAAPADPALAGMAFTCSYDEGFCGHFSIPGGDGAAARFADVVGTPNALPFIRDHLEFRPLNYQSPPGADADELVVFVPGLNTLHMVKDGWWDETTTPQRLVHYAGVLQRPLAQMHLGTDMDQGDAPVPVSAEARAFLEANRGALEGGGVMPRLADGHAFWAPRQRDRMESALSRIGLARPLLQKHLVRLLQINEAERQPLVLMPYSRGSAEVCGALQQYIDGYVEARAPGGRAEEARAEVQGTLRQHVTVFTVGNVSREWPDGPAYVHMSALSGRAEGGTDPLTQAQGVSARNPQGAGADAVFLHPDGLFSGFDAHNFGASGASNLRIIMNMNKCVTLRDVWEAARAGPLRMPTYRETAAGVELSTGKRWLWEPEQARRGVQLMPPDAARDALGGFWTMPAPAAA